MPRFEVLCPASPPLVSAGPTIGVDAEHWVAALKAALLRLGKDQVVDRILCDVQEDGTIQVTSPRGGGVFRIREVREGAPPAGGALAPAAAPGGAGGLVAADGPGRPPAAPAAPQVPIPLVKRPRESARAVDLPGAPPPQLAALASLDRQAGLELVLDVALERVGAEAGSVLLVRADRPELEFVAVRGPKAKSLQGLRPVVPVGMGVVGYCVQEGIALAVSDAQSDRRYLWAISLAVGYETRSILCAPIARPEKVLGAVEVLNKRGDVPFGAQDLAILSYLAGRAAEHLARHGA
jgi:hypothetical protein